MKTLSKWFENEFKKLAQNTQLGRTLAARQQQQGGGRVNVSSNMTYPGTAQQNPPNAKAGMQAQLPAGPMQSPAPAQTQSGALQGGGGIGTGGIKPGGINQGGLSNRPTPPGAAMAPTGPGQRPSVNTTATRGREMQQTMQASKAPPSAAPRPSPGAFPKQAPAAGVSAPKMPKVPAPKPAASMGGKGLPTGKSLGIPSSKPPAPSSGYNPFGKQTQKGVLGS